MKDNDSPEPYPGKDEAAHEEPPYELDLFGWEELDFELELALGRSTVLQAADRLLRGDREPAVTPVLVMRRNRPTH